MFHKLWYRLGHRTRTVHAFGMVVLEILGTKIEDTGTYTCQATNKWGRAEITVQLECVDKSKGQKPQFTTQIKVNYHPFMLFIYEISPPTMLYPTNLEIVYSFCLLVCK